MRPFNNELNSFEMSIWDLEINGLFEPGQTKVE
jgi:hypothetical protein